MPVFLKDESKRRLVNFIIFLLNKFRFIGVMKNIIIKSEIKNLIKVANQVF